MQDNIEKFFLSLKQPNYLSMKLLLDVFHRMQIADNTSRKTVNNIEVLEPYQIHFVDSNSSFNYVFSEDDLREVTFAIANSGSEYSTCHEFGHLLLDIFARGEVPAHYEEINVLCIHRLMSRDKDVSRMISRFRDESFYELTQNVSKIIDFLETYPEFQQDYFDKNPGSDYNELLQNALIDYFGLLSSFDQKISGYHRIGNIIDSMFHGENPFSSDYGNEEFYPVISKHDEDYFLEDSQGKLVAGFEEEFAEYLVLRLYGDRMVGVVNTMHNLVGDEWFDMMDSFYEEVASRVVEKNKSIQYQK